MDTITDTGYDSDISHDLETSDEELALDSPIGLQHKNALLKTCSCTMKSTTRNCITGFAEPN